jgi:hypothetical protein
MSSKAGLKASIIVQPGWNDWPDCTFKNDRKLRGRPAMRGILLWLIGIPIPIIILLYLFHVI